MSVKVEFSLNTVELEVKYLYNHLKHRPLKLGSLIVLQETHLWLLKILFP